MKNSGKYLVAFTTQVDDFYGVETCHRIGSVVATDRSLSSDDALIIAREMHSIPDDHRVIASLICPLQPFDKPTECQLAVTLMASGERFSPRLRQAGRIFNISDEFTLGHAFAELVNREPGWSVVGWSYTPTILHPAP